MADKSGIEWTEATWNPTTGCVKVSPGCKYCYAKHKAWPRLSKNPNTVYFGRDFENVQCHPERLNQPLRWTRPRMIFVNSMSDLFHEDIPFEFIDRVFNVMTHTTRHIYQVLTKRPKRMLDYFAHLRSDFGGVPDAISDSEWPGDWVPMRGGRGGYDNCGPLWPAENVWMGVSVENQSTADERIPMLLKVPAAVRWISCEPLLGPTHMSDAWLNDLHWVVVGGESGTKARPMNAEWAESIFEQCAVTNVPFFMKQGSQSNWPDYHDFESFPASLKVREYPVHDGQSHVD